MKLTAKASIQIQKTVQDVFEGIVNPEKMTQYFIAESTGRLEEGKEVIWKFPEFPELECLIKNVRIEKYRSISFVWDDETTVNIYLEEQADQSVVIKVEEGAKELNDPNLQWLIGNTEGWANFLACMKAYLEYGVNLRKGAFAFLQNSSPDSE